ncbi:MAG: divalent-cation tolerance protein CutA [Candidatus Omnitrophota bacterium]
MEKLYMIYVPVSSKKEAERIAEGVISKRLAACANIIENIGSVYWWEGTIKKDKETLLIFKTKGSLLDRAEKEIKKLHSYECPCIACLPIDRVNEEYAEWVEKSVQGSGDRGRKKV